MVNESALFDNHKKRWVKVSLGLIWLSILVFIYLYKSSQDLTTTDLSLRLLSFVTSTVWGPLLYILIYTVRPLTFFPGSILTILSGIFFGLYGIIYTIIGANLSATLAYFIGHYFSHNSKLDFSLNKWKKLLQENPFISIVTMHLTFLPYDIVNYGAGLLKVPFLPFIFATIIGTLLGIITFVSIGASLSLTEFLDNGISFNVIDMKFILFSIIVFVVSLVLAKYLKKQKSTT